MKNIDFTINNDEIEKISKRIHELQTLIEKDIPLSEEQMEEYKSLFRLKDLLYRANQIDDKEAFIVVDGMRIERNKVKEFKELLKIVKVVGLATMPSYLGDILPGTKYKMPREKNNKETFEQYEEYLYNYYKKLGYVFENITYHPATKVPILRKPYPHEMYYPSENGFVYDEAFLGTHNEYYQTYRRYLEEQLAIEYQNVIENAITNFTILPPIGSDINRRHKVTRVELFSLLTKKITNGMIKKKNLVGKSNLIQPSANFENKSLENLDHNLKVDFNIPEHLKNALDKITTHNKSRVINVEFTSIQRVFLAKNILNKKLAEAINENFEVKNIEDGFYLYKMVPKDILIGNALSKRTVKEKRIAYEIASKFRRLMSEDSSLSHYHDMMLKSFLEANQEVTMPNGETITPENMRIVI